MAGQKTDTKHLEVVPAPNVRFFEDWAKQRGFRSIHEVSEKITSGESRSNESALRNVFAKERRLKLVEMVRLSEQLRLPISVVLYELGYNEQHGFKIEDPHAVIAGEVNKRAVLVRSKRADRVLSPEFEEGLAVAIMNTANSPLEGWHNAKLFFVDNKEVRHERSDQLCMIQTTERSAAVLGYVKPSHLATFVELLGTGERFKTSKLISTSPIKWVQMP